MQIIKRLSVLLAALIAVLTFSACDGFQIPGAAGGSGGNDQAHEHKYSIGQCACGDIDRSIVTENLQYEDVNANTCAVVGYLGADKVVVIPSEHDGKTVTTIKTGAFEGVPETLNVILPDTITTIEARAFNACADLRRINVPKNLNRLGAGAFLDCLKVVEIRYNAVNCQGGQLDSDYFENVGNDADGVKVIVDSEVEILPRCIFNASKFAKSANIKSVVFEDNSKCKEISYCAFRSATRMTSITFGENSSLERIGDTAFGNCYLLNNVILPASLKRIDPWAFSKAGHQVENMVIKMEDPNGWSLVQRSSDGSGGEDIQLPFAVTFADVNNVEPEMHLYPRFLWLKG